VKQSPFKAWFEGGGCIADAFGRVVFAFRLRLGDAFELALLAKIGLKLSKHTKHVEEALASGKAAIDRFSQSLPVYADMRTILQFALASKRSLIHYLPIQPKVSPIGYTQRPRLRVVCRRL